MTKLMKIFAGMMLLAGAIAFTPGTAMAQYHHGWHGHGGWHGGWGRGFGWGYGWGWGAPYAYYPPPVYYAPGGDCGWVRVRAWRHGHWVVRRTWRCW